eukprot:16430541-Heterocapsa_arctica.AAC.1
MESIKGDGNCLHACLGKSRKLSGNQVRQIAHSRAAEFWQQNMDYDIDGSGLANFLEQTLDTKEWGVMVMSLSQTKSASACFIVCNHGKWGEQANH